MSGIPRGALADHLGISESSTKTLVHRALLKSGAESLADVVRDLLRET